MNKNRLIHFLYISIILFIITTALFVIRSKSDQELVDMSVYEDLKKDSFNYQQIYSIVMEQTASDNLCLKDTLSVIREDGANVLISDIVNSKDKFVIRFNDIGCSSCIKYFKDNIESLVDFINKVGQDNVIIVLNTDNPRALHVFKKQYKLPCSVYGLLLGGLSPSMEIQETVVAYYFFVLSKDLMIENSFINIQNWPERTDAYFNALKRKYNACK